MVPIGRAKRLRLRRRLAGARRRIEPCGQQAPAPTLPRSAHRLLRIQLHRTTRKRSLTIEGEMFHAGSLELPMGVEEAEAEVTTPTYEVVGVLRVSVPMSFGLPHLAPLWPAFLQLQPKITLNMTQVDRIVDAMGWR